MKLVTIGSSIALCLGLCATAAAQDSSLFRRDPATETKGGITLATGSWSYRAQPVEKEFRLHDLVTIAVKLESNLKSSGDMQRRKNSSYDAVLKDWIMLVGLRAIKPDPQSDGDQRVQGQLNQIFRAEGDMQTSELLKFTITAEIADIRPNGSLVLEARQNIQVNNENWEYSLSGICRREDILPNNTVPSQSLAELNIVKRDRGHVRDSYKRGWFTRWFDQVSPF